MCISADMKFHNSYEVPSFILHKDSNNFACYLHDTLFISF